MDDAFFGEIRVFAGSYAPMGWALCNGQTLSIQMYPALYSLLGTRYGGDGQRTFNLPNFNGRAPIGMGQGPGLSNRIVGQTDGTPTYVLNQAQLPPHNHAVACNTAPTSGTLNDPNGNFWGTSPINRSTGQSVNTRYAPATDGTYMDPASLSPFGATMPQAISNLQPMLGLNFIICIEGWYPDFDD